MGFFEGRVTLTNNTAHFQVCLCYGSCCVGPKLRDEAGAQTTNKSLLGVGEKKKRLQNGEKKNNKHEKSRNPRTLCGVFVFYAECRKARV